MEILREEGHAVTAAPTTGPKMAGALARAHGDGGADLIVVLGGDGTVNEVGGGDAGVERADRGTARGNGECAGHGDAAGTQSGERSARAGRVAAPADLGGARGCAADGVTRHFLLMAGVGLDAHVVYRVNAALKARTGKFAYWVAGWSLLGKRLNQFEVEIDGGAAHVLVRAVE